MDSSSKRFNNLTKEERNALYSLTDDPTIIIKGADKGSAVVVWDREDNVKEASKQLKKIKMSMRKYKMILAFL